MHRIRVETAFFVAVIAIIAWLVLYPAIMLLAGTVTTDNGSLTLQYWREALSLSVLPEIFWNTIAVSVLATALAVVIGLLCAFLVARTDMPLGTQFEYISIVPFLTPPIMAGLAWQQLAERQSGVINLLLQAMHVQWRIDIMTMTGIVFVSSLYLVPFVFLITVSALRSINPELEEAALMSGTSRTRALLRVTFPLIMPAISSAALLAFMYSNILFGIHATLGMPVNIWFLTTAVYHAMNVVPADLHRAAVMACLLMLIAATATYFQIRLLSGSKGYQTISGKGMRSQKIALGAWRWTAAAFCLGYIVIVAVVPYAVLLLRSLKPFMFQPGMNWIDLVTGWDLRPYASFLMLRDAVVTRSLWNSLILSIGATVLCMALTALAAYFVARSKMRGRAALTFVCMVPMALPGVVLGIAVLWGYSRPHLMLYGTLWILLVAYVIKDIPLGFNSIRSFFVQINAELEESARVCGATWLRQLRTVTLPLVRPGFVIGCALVLASILREVGASIILYTHGSEVVAYVLFNHWENGEFQALSAFVILTTILTLILVAILLRLGRLRFTDLTGSEVRQS